MLLFASFDILLYRDVTETVLKYYIVATLVHTYVNPTPVYLECVLNV